MSPAAAPNSASVLVGSGRFRYRALERWQQLPAGWDLVEVAGVATDSEDRVYVFNRGEHPVIVFDREGNFLSSWGEGVFAQAHGIFIGPDDAVYTVDDNGHTVRKFTSAGKLLWTLGTHGKASETGAVGHDYRTIQRAGPPFNTPTNLALAPGGEMYITDGYGNARVHKYSPDGRLLFSWGQPGSGPGEFHLPHGIAVDRRGTVYVADRENSRIQLFSPDGKYLDQWPGVARPCQIFVDREDYFYVAEVGYRAGMYPGNEPPADHDAAPGPATGGRVSIFSASGELVARWGGGENPCAVGDFFAPHDIWVDSRGDVYVGEVTMSAGGRKGLVSPDCHSLQKFVREKQP